MSKYEDYSEVSKVYDKERTAMGVDTIVGLLHVYGGKPLKVGHKAFLKHIFPSDPSSTLDFACFRLVVGNQNDT